MRRLHKNKTLSKRSLLNHTGDTLIEVLLSVTALGLVLALSFTAATRSLNAGTDAANRNRALAFAKEQVELLRDAANSGNLSDYPTNGTSFCVDPTTKDSSSPDSSGYCHLDGQDPFGVIIKFNSSNQTYAVTSEWQGMSTQDSVVLYYQVPLGPITTSPIGLTLTPETAAIASGGQVTIKWSTKSGGALSCQASGDWSGSQPTSGQQTFTNLTASKTYTLTCTGTDGVSTETRSATITVASAAAPDIIFKAAPASVASGGTTTLIWQATDAADCYPSAGPSDWMSNPDRRVSSSFNTAAINSDTTYAITCDSNQPGGSSSQASVTVPIADAPKVSLTSSKDSIEYYQGTTLKWTVSNVTSCTASSSDASWSGSIRPKDGQQTLDHLSSGTKRYTLDCTGPGGSKSAQTTVFVNNNPGFCIDANFQNCTYFSSNESNLSSQGLNDTISSVLVPPGRREILYKDANFQGACYVAASNVANMGSTNVGNDELSSFKNASSGGC
ncbi:MAG TPA: hypothetical protein VFT49_02750 [Candidatus Saccharimonadales bacterium]|nr:hypothetical protein [Candidatus Saccharimonadales bacterium]